MASTYSPQDALNLVQQFGHSVPVSSVAAMTCDMVNKIMWRFYPWSWSIKNFTTITCTDGVQDYNVVDTDVLRPLQVRLVRTDVSPNEYRELSMLANLPVELTRKGGLDTNTSFGYFGSGPFIRLMYAASVGTGMTLQIQGFYQFTPAKITDTNLSTPFTFPDDYLNVFVEGLKWQVYGLADDPRAGTLQYSKNGSMMRQYTGQLGMFVDALLEMGRTEDLKTGDEFSFPEQPLGVGRSYWPGLYGL